MHTARTRAALTAALFLAALPAPRAAGVSTLHVEVHEGDRAEPKLRMEMPLDVVEAVTSSLRKEAIDRIPFEEIEQHGFDVRAFWRKIREAEINEFFTLETDDAHVRGWREGGLFRLSIVAERDKDEARETCKVEVRLPEILMDLLVEEPGPTTGGDVVQALRRFGPMTLVEVKSDHGESVRVWID